jgi:hypothetical protein
MEPQPFVGVCHGSRWCDEQLHRVEDLPEVLEPRFNLRRSAPIAVRASTAT